MRRLWAARLGDHDGMLPIGDDNSDLRRSPVVVWGLILSCLGAWVWQLFDDGALARTWGVVPWELSNARHLGGVTDVNGSVIHYPPTPEPWMLWLTPLTAMFLHGGWLHILGNMLYLAIFGDQIEDRLGHVRFLFFYLACGVLACAAHVLQDLSSVIPMIGASGAIAGVLGAYLRCCPMKRVTVLIGILPLPVPAFLVLGFWFLLQWAGIRQEGATAIAYAAHIGGFVAGFILLGVMRPREAAP